MDKGKMKSKDNIPVGDDRVGIFVPETDDNFSRKVNRGYPQNRGINNQTIGQMDLMRIVLKK